MTKTEFNNLKTKKLQEKLDEFYSDLEDYDDEEHNIRKIVSNIVEAEIEMESRCNI